MIRLYDSDSHSNFNSNSYRLSQLCHHVNGVHPALSCLLLCNCQYTMSQCFEPAMRAEKRYQHRVQSLALALTLAYTSECWMLNVCKKNSKQISIDQIVHMRGALHQTVHCSTSYSLYLYIHHLIINSCQNIWCPTCPWNRRPDCLMLTYHISFPINQ